MPMKTSVDVHGKHSRRAVLLGCAGLVLAGAARPAEAQQKMAQKLVQYQQQPKGSQQCELCLHFVAPSSCKLVEGTINPKGWCALFAPKPK